LLFKPAAHRFGVIACLSLTSQAAAAQGVRVAAASDLHAALPAIAAAFEKETGQQATLTFGSSGNFFTQIQNGAPFDVFLSADIDYPRQLERGGQAERGSLYEYAKGRLVLWTRNDSGIDVRRGLGVLTDTRIRHVAIANPEHAPYGRAAVAALRHENLYERVRGRFVLGENISQAAQFAQSGNAEVGVLALSLALAPAMTSVGTYFEIPDAWHPPIAQAAVVLTSSSQKARARQFIEYLQRPKTVQLLQSYGFALPQATRR
jgi:molybdate transport system substrate-binding protein